ncbi:MAG: carbon storage regulator [Planctomycetaceae bacterium]
MLVLSRKVGEKLVINNNITLVVSRISGNRVTLALEAPQDVRVMRGELEAPSVQTPAASQRLSGLSGNIESCLCAVPRLAK